MLFEIHPDDVTAHLRPGKRILIACVHRDEEYEEHRREVATVARAFEGKLATLWTDPRLSPGFMKVYGIHGTPTYLLLNGEGMELGRLEGRADSRMLKRFISAGDWWRNVFTTGDGK
ncbi:MAG: TlpA family protein disulfide reductase [Desulfovibrio sp.]